MDHVIASNILNRQTHTSTNLLNRPQWDRCAHLPAQTRIPPYHRNASTHAPQPASVAWSQATDEELITEVEKPFAYKCDLEWERVEWHETDEECWGEL
jgi:hypothetical protein